MILEVNAVMLMRLIVALVVLFGVASADPIVINIVPIITGPSAGLFIYTYDVTNDMSSSENLFSLSIGEIGSVTEIVSPSGWVSDTVSTPGFIIWTSEDQATDLTPGSTDVFGFVSLLPPAMEPFLGFGSDPFTGFPTGDLDFGSTSGPAPPTNTVPEPTSCVLTACCLAALIFARQVKVGLGT